MGTSIISVMVFFHIVLYLPLHFVFSLLFLFCIYFHQLWYLKKFFLVGYELPALVFGAEFLSFSFVFTCILVGKSHIRRCWPDVHFKSKATVFF